MKKVKYIGFLLFIVLAMSGGLVEIAEAQQGLVPCGTQTTPPCRLCHLALGIQNIINWGFRILVFVAITGLVVSGIMYIVSAGNSEMMESAKRYMKQILTGFAIVIGAWLIINVTMYALTVTDSEGGFLKFEGSWYEMKFTCPID